ncbi:MAG: anthranilate phosphoribosyltransferase [Candidatus Binatia bacterium]
MKTALASLVAGQDLSDAEMSAAMSTIMDGDATAAQIGAFLAALAAKGETVEELAAAVRVLRERAVELRTAGPVIDTCGTGGDGLGTFNVSTAAAFVAAAAGAKVAKHGNRASSGQVGAADVLEALGANIELGPEAAGRCLDRCGITFLFAPAYHPAVRHVAAARRELGFRTLFNLTGPLCNPAGARRQVVGLFSRDWLLPVAETLRRLGSEHVLVVHGGDGSDEITPAAETHVVELAGGEIRSYDIAPEDFGMARATAGDLAGGDAGANAQMLREVLGGQPGARADATALNAGAAIRVAGIAASLAGGVARAREILKSGEALGVLEAFVAESRDAAGERAHAQGSTT